jgi:hypothetical protein
MANGGSTFVIVEGVRRAKAWLLSGAATVRARVLHPDGTMGPEMDVPIADLFSPRDEIDLSSAGQAQRFWRIWNVIQNGNGAALPPIVVRPGSRGTPVKDVRWKR